MHNVRHKSRKGLPSTARRSDPTMDKLLMLFIGAIFIPKGVMLPVGSFDITPFQLIGAILICMIIIERKIRWAWLDLLVVGYLLVVMISMVVSSGVARAAESSGRIFLEYGGPYLVGRYIASDSVRFWQVSRWLLNCMVVLVPLLVVEALFSVNVHRMIWGLVFDISGVYREERLGMRRAMGWSSHPIILGLSYASMFPLTAYVAMSRSRELGRGVRFKTFLIVMGVFFSLSSGPWLMLAVICGLFFLDKLPVASGLKWGSLFIGAPLTWAFLEAVSGRAFLRILMMKLHLTNSMAWHYRWLLYERVLKQMPGHWYLGHGLQIPEEFTGNIGWSIDNQYLVVLLNTGVIGLVMWICMMLSVFMCRYRGVWSGPSSGLAAVARSVRFSILAIAAVQLTVAMFSTANVMFFWMMGVAVSLGYRCSDPPIRPPIKGISVARRHLHKGPVVGTGVGTQNR